VSSLNLLRSKKYYFILAIVIASAIYFGFALYSYLVINKSKFPKNTFFASADISKLNIDDSIDKVNEHLKNIKITLLINDAKVNTNAYDLGIYASSINANQFYQVVRIKSSLMPFISFKNTYDNLNFDEFIYKNNLQNGMPKSLNPPINASFNLNDQNQVIILDGKTGNLVNLNDYRTNLLNQIYNGQTNIELKAQLSDNINPAITTDILQNNLAKANIIYKNQYQLTTDTTAYKIDNKIIVNKLSLIKDNQIGISIEHAKEIINNSLAKANTMPTDEVTTNYVSGRPSIITQDGQTGKKVNNYDTLSAKLTESVGNVQNFSANITFDEVSYDKESVLLDDLKQLGQINYKISSWGDISKSDLDEFSKLVDQTLNDGRGWAKTGIIFRQVTSNDEFEIVLSEANELPKRYPNICDNFYSCRVGRYVIVNADRWKQATPVWSLSLRDYRHLVVNHEVGHLLGLGHPKCPQAGSLAPAMLQQSINLEGCTFNPWPLPNEIKLAQSYWNR
jgi:hypothetical protein